MQLPEVERVFARLADRPHVRRRARATARRSQCSAPDAVPLLVQLGLLSAVTGDALAALILGHWYLVTPKLSVAPLVLLTRLQLVAVGLQLAVFAFGQPLAADPGRVHSTP